MTGKEIEMLQSLFNFLSSIAFFVSSAFGINMSTEQQRYEVIEQIGKKIEIRQYPTRIVAETTVDASISDNPRGDAFRIVAAYIFGANKARQKIDMTAPVEIAKPSAQSARSLIDFTPCSLKATSICVVTPGISLSPSSTPSSFRLASKFASMRSGERRGSDLGTKSV